MYDSSKDINNWSQWIEKEVRSCDGHIILLCGKKLHEALQKHYNEKIKMHNAHIGKLTLSSLIDDQEINTRFVPVFIGKPNKQFIPTALSERTFYTAPYDAVIMDLDSPQAAEAVIKRAECRSLYSLVSKLNNQPEHDKPPVNDLSNGKYYQVMYYLLGSFIPAFCYYC